MDEDKGSQTLLNTTSNSTSKLEDKEETKKTYL